MTEVRGVMFPDSGCYIYIYYMDEAGDCGRDAIMLSCGVVMPVEDTVMDQHINKTKTVIYVLVIVTTQLLQL